MIRYKKKLSYLLLLVVSLLVLSACSTTVTVSYLQPAKYDITKYKNLAIASMEVDDIPPYSNSLITVEYDDFEEQVFSGYNRRIAYNVAETFTEELYDDLYKSSYFNIIKPSITDGYLSGLKYGVNSLNKLRDLGADAILVSQIDSIDYNEYTIIGDYKVIRNPDYYSDPTQDEYIEDDEREVTIVQQATIEFSYKIVDIDTGEIIASDSFKKTLTHDIDYNEDIVTLPSMEPIFEKAILYGESQIIEDLAPQYISTTITLKKNKSGNPYFDAGMDATKKGSLRVAYDSFDTAWTNSKLYEAGYNSALVLEALGERDLAIDRMNEVYNYFSDIDSYEQLSRMEQYKYNTNVAKDQITN
ncbi:MAG: hypothetical protein ACPKMZ_03670 [Pleomorphochaeta sp.]